MRVFDLSSHLTVGLATEIAESFEISLRVSAIFVAKMSLLLYYGFADTTTKYPPSRLLSEET